jgi:hypothetical protein
MIETLALAGAEHIDQQAAERWFDLRNHRRGPLAGSPGTS